ncbi:MAG: bifunctional (p)ppGpp synthetase/guanosine-3',5'-bis(diphosphate) 3'-pyrophosphohydrolase [Coriobacteriales bacterium]|jgi:GTP pyrophosphokinase|nr:bifunctional (p)ppGpp synthetase/guanosine-3',5'-bis(diphosphate) 3'-pyrophosphohydrolase [Coriobacteriales bacterium]
MTDAQDKLMPELTGDLLESWENLLQQVKSYMNDADCIMVEKAFHFARLVHADQVRKSGELYISHPVQVAMILGELRMDADTVAAALLHDTVEDTEVELSDLIENFNPDIAALVEGVTKITRIEVESLSEQQVNNLRKMFIAMNKDIRVIVIKLADRLHNMRTLTALREDRRIFKARETMEIYAPLAHRLGINSIKWELEDLAFYYLEPARFNQVSRMVADSREAREAYLAESIRLLTVEFEKLGIKAHITGRPKHLWSIYQKMSQKGKDFSEIYDLIALRVIVETINECYTCLGAAHVLWTPLTGRFKDYIATPKANGYKSLHTTVIGSAGRPLEIQIRTTEMHHTAEYGVAAHWRYKGRSASKEDKILDEQLAWLRQMLEATEETEDPREFMDYLRQGLDYSEVFVFTPKGEVIPLRSGSTPIDFAYAIHTQVGHHCVGAKVNGNIVPLSYELNIGDRVEILTQKNSGPSRDWLNIVKTASARSKIRSYLSKQGRGDDIQRGKDLLSAEMRRHNLGVSSPRSQKALKKLATEMIDGNADDLLALIGSNKQSARQVAHRLIRELSADQTPVSMASPELLLEYGAGTGIHGDSATDSPLLPIKRPQQHQQRKSGSGSSGVIVKGLDGVLVRLAHCCNPVPGDEIIGFITRGRGVSVHRSDCPNASDLCSTPERIIPVSWADRGGSKNTYNVEVFVEGIDRLRLYDDVTSALASSGVNMMGASMQVHPDGIVEMRYLFEVSEIAHINRILRDLRNINSVIDARRMLPNETLSKRYSKY